jgi:hypothetical protein
MPLSVEELLRPRIKCMIRYPDSPFPVGAILEQDIEEPNIYHYRDSQNRHWTLEDPQLYPEVFKEMQWWEDRKPDDMPKYVKEGDFIGKAKWKAGVVTENGQQPMRMSFEDSNGDWQAIPNVMCFFQPATLADYQAYINNQKVKE